MTRIVQFFEKKVLCFSVLVIIINLIISKTVLLLPYEGFNGKMLIRILSLTIPTLIFIYGIKKIFGEWNFGFKKQKLLYGMLIGWLMFIYTALSFLPDFLDTPADHLIVPNILSLILCVISDLMIGVREEVLVRGIILNYMVKQWKDRKNFLMLSVIASSILFGLMHLVNLINNPVMINETIGQVIYTTFIGIFFAAVYLKSTNLWSVIILHGMFDFADDIFKVITITNSNLKAPADCTLIDALLNSMLFLPLAVVGLIIVFRIGNKAIYHKKYISKNI